MSGKSDIRLGDLLREWRFTRILILCAALALLGLGWPPDLRHRWFALLPLVIVLVMVGVGYGLARRNERRRGDGPPEPLDLSGREKG